MDTTATVGATLRITGIDLDATETAEVLGSLFPDLIWEERDNFALMSVSVPTDNVTAHVVDLYRRLMVALPGLTVDGVDRDYVNVTDIAFRVGVSHEAALRWSAHADFPVPHAVPGGGSEKIWVWGQVQQWLREARKIDMGGHLLTVQQMTHLENCLLLQS